MSNMTSMNPSTPCYQLYQNLVDRLFGSDVIEIKKARKDNNVIGALKYIDSYHEFINNFEARLTRLRDRYKDTKSYKTLLQTVAQIADYNNWEGAYAELVAYDVMSNGGLSSILNLTKRCLLVIHLLVKWEDMRLMKMVSLVNIICILTLKVFQILLLTF